MFNLKNPKILFACLLACSQSVYADQLFSLDSSLTGWNLPASISTLPNATTTHALTVTNQQVNLAISGSSFSISPASGSYLAVLNPYSLPRISDNGGSYNIDSDLGLTAGTFYNSLYISGDNNSKPTNVSVISRNVTLNTATPYSFYWAYAAQDYNPYKDGVFFSYSTGGSGTLVVLARNGNVTTPTVSTGSAGFPSGTIVLPNYGTTSWNKFTFVVPSTGTYKVAFGAFNAGDTSVNPILFLADQNGTILGNVFSTGPSPEDTLASMQGNSNSLRRIFSLQASYLNPGLSYDCSLFDTKGICASFSGRYSNTTGSTPEATSGVLSIAFKATPNIRIGGFVEQYSADITNARVRVDSRNPDFGIFGVWSKTETGEGLKVRAAYRYGKKDVTINREAIGSAEAGSGKSSLITEGAQLTVSNGYRLNNTLLATPYIGLRYTNIERAAYAESVSATVASPLTYNTLRQEATSLLLGANLAVQVAPAVVVTASIGAETDLSRQISNYSASGVADLNAIQFNNNTRRTRAVASAGAAYRIDKAQQVSAQVLYREEAFDSISTTTAMLTYTVGF